jgi:succinoglycan biosynthesis transport protein ExoP
MLETIKSSPRSDQKSTLGAPEDEPVGGANLGQSVKSIASIVHRQLPIFLVVIPCVMALGLLYLVTTPPSYTALAKMLIDTRKVPAFQQQQSFSDQTIDNVAVATQVEVLTSENVSLAVIRDLKLTEDPEFIGPSAGLIGTFFNLISSTFDSGTVQSESKLLRRALAAFEARRKVIRLPQTYAMEISFWSFDPGKAAQIANTISDAYIVDQLEAKDQSTRRASAWLQDRITTLRAEASAASQAVVDFKEKNNIIESGGKLMNEQQMSEVNSQLLLARAATAEAKARLERITQVISKDIPDASVADALNNQVVIKLRGQYLELVGRESIWSKKYGPDHLATISIRNQMLELRRNIADEMQKIAESYKSDYQIALTRETSILKSLDTAVAQSRITNQAQVQLREFESKAGTSRSMYDNFLQRYMEAVQQQSFPISEARLITPATPPRIKSHPKTLTVLVLSAAGGFIIAFGAAVLREASNRVFRTGAQVQDVLHVSCVAMLPFLKRVAPIAAADHQEDAASLTQARRIRRSDNLLNYVVDAPFSQFTELLRSLKVVADLKGAVQANRVIGVTSTLPNEGKSTIAANFAAMIAHAGSRVILVDADLRKSSLSQALSPGASVGLLEVAAGQIALAEAVWTDSGSWLTFLPAGSQSAKVLHPNEILASSAINSLIDKLRDTFDYVIVDCAPLAPVVDTRTTTSFTDSYLYVIEWGRTKIDVVKHNLSAAPEIYDRLLGVVLNKANMSVLQRYEPYRTTYYYRKYSRSGDVS